jgi:excisionase family DNA binding protein
VNGAQTRAPRPRPRPQTPKQEGANLPAPRLLDPHGWNGSQSPSAPPALTVPVPDELLRAVAEHIAAALAPLLHQPQGEPYLDVDAAARYLSCDRQRIYDLVSAGRLEPHRDGRRLLFRSEHLDAYVHPGGTIRD